MDCKIMRRTIESKVHVANSNQVSSSIDEPGLEDSPSAASLCSSSSSSSLSCQNSEEFVPPDSVKADTSLIISECEVCLERFGLSEIVKSSDFCTSTGEDCEGVFCQKCIEEYFSSHAKKNIGYLIRITCPCCTGVVPIKNWRSYITETLFQELVKRAEGTAFYRCTNCDESSSVLGKAPDQEWVSSLRKRGIKIDYLFDIDQQTFDAEKSASRDNLKNGEGETCKILEQSFEKLSILAQGIPQAPQKPPPSPYDPRIFYFIPRIQEKYQELSEIRRKYFLKEMNADQVIDELEKLPYTQNSQKVQLWIEEIVKYFTNDYLDLRVALILRGVKRKPMIKTRCCKQIFCMSCHGDHGENQSCNTDETFMATESVRTCPVCDIALLKMAGCSDVLCVCGKRFNWSEAKTLQQRQKQEQE